MYRPVALFLACALLASARPAAAQTRLVGTQFLAVDHATRLKRFRIFPGEELRVKLYSEGTFVRYTLEGIRNDSLFIGSDRTGLTTGFPLSEVKALKWKDRSSQGNFARLFGRMLQAGSVFFLAVRGINGAASKEPNVFSPVAVGSAAAGYTAGALLVNSGNRTFRVGEKRKWHLRIIDMRQEVQAPATDR